MGTSLLRGAFEPERRPVRGCEGVLKMLKALTVYVVNEL